MPIVALIKFVQGLSTPPAGEALVGVLTTPVTVSNGDPTDTQAINRRFTVVDRPPTSTVPLGVVSDGTVNGYTFVPDARGGYLFELAVTDAAGNQSIDRRVFQVPESSGYLIPPFQADDRSFNYGGQLRGWAKAMEELLRALLAAMGGGGGGDALTFMLAENVNKKFAVVSDGAGGYVKATTANLAAADYVIAGVVLVDTLSGAEAPGLASGRLPDAFMGAGTAGGLTVDATGLVVRGSIGRNVGWVDTDGSGFFYASPVKTAGFQHVFNAADMGMIAGDSSAPVRASNNAILQSLLDATDLLGGNTGRIAVYMPGGNYFMSDASSIIVRRIALWFGDGLGTTLFWPGTMTIPAVRVKQSDSGGTGQYAVIREMRFIGGYPSEGFSAVVNPNGNHGVILEASVSTLEYVHVLNFGGNGVYINGVGPQAADFVRVEHCTIGQNHGFGIELTATENSNSYIEHNLYQENTAGDIRDNAPLGTLIVGGSFESQLAPRKLDIDGSAGGTTCIGVEWEGPEVAFVKQPGMLVGGGSASAGVINPYNVNGQIFSPIGNRCIRSLFYRFVDAPWTANTVMVVGQVRRPTTFDKATGRKYIVVSVIGDAKTGALEPVWRTNAFMTKGGGYAGTPALIVDNNVTWAEYAPIDAVQDSLFMVDQPSGTTVYGFALQKLGVDSLSGHLYGTNVGGVGTGWWSFVSSASISTPVFSFSTDSNAEAHNYTGGRVFWPPQIKLGAPGGSLLFLDTGTVAPASGARYTGDFRFNKPTALGTFAAWQNYSAGSPGLFAVVWNDDPKTGLTAQTSLDWADTSATDAGSLAAKAKVRSRRKTAQTTTATADQVLDDGGTWGNQNLAFTEGEIREIDVVLVAKRNTLAEGSVIKIAGVYMYEAGVFINIGTDDNVTKESGANITGTTGQLFDNGSARIGVRVTPANAITIDWTIARQDTTRLE